MTRDNGSPVGDNQNSRTSGPEGPVLLQDSHLIENRQRFDRERIPERVVHARGTGVFGEFVPTADLSDLIVAKVFDAGADRKIERHVVHVLSPQDKASRQLMRDRGHQA
jgi:catalase